MTSIASRATCLNPKRHNENIPMNTNHYPGVILIILFLLYPASTLAGERANVATRVQQAIEVPPFQPPDETSIGDDAFGTMVRLGKDVFTETRQYAGDYVGNALSCSNCHLNAGRLAHSAPLWAAWVSYPAYRGKNQRVNTMTERIQGCFRYSMNGTPPPADSKTLKALMSYSFWLASGAPTNRNLPGRGYPKLDKPPKPADFDRGEKVFNNNCALCHGANGQGTRVNDNMVFPPLWGPESFNWGAGMHRINTAASFIRANMPFGKAGSLSLQEAWDVAYYINSHERPQDPRFDGDIGATDHNFHNHQCRYGDRQDKHRLGQP